ncbi:MAG: HIT family protein [Hyphomicrobiales bacterium]
MKTMWAPWRIEYVLGEKEKGCVFCKALSVSDELTLFKGAETLVVMNKYPYNNGHLLVAPVRHIAALDELSRQEMGVLLATVEQSVAVLKKAMRPEGFNVGLNLGKIAGAGVEEHLHFHIVPRWSGDTNALAVFADVRVISQHIRETHALLKPHFEKIRLDGCKQTSEAAQASGCRNRSRGRARAADASSNA